MKDDFVYLNQIRDSITKTESFVAGLDKEAFLNDLKTQSAVIMQLALIGEVSKKISTDLKEKIDLPWKDIAGFRDRAIHDYFEIDLEIVWNTIVIDIPELRKAISGALE